MPPGLLGRLEAISQEPGAELTDEQLDSRLRDVPLPAGLIAGLERIADRVPSRVRWGSLVAAASLALIVSLSYAGAMLGVAMAAYQTRVYEEAWEAQLRIDFIEVSPEPSDDGMFADPVDWQLSAAPVIEDDSQLGVYASSDWAERLFCQNCGSNLFYRLRDGSHHSVHAGALDDLSDAKFTMEIFIDEKPDYYAFEGDRKKLTGQEVMAMFAGGQEDNNG